MNKRVKPIPKFASEAAERACWEKNDSAVYMDWKKAQVAVLPNLKPSTQTISLQLPSSFRHLSPSIAPKRNSLTVRITVKLLRSDTKISSFQLLAGAGDN